MPDIEDRLRMQVSQLMHDIVQAVRAGNEATLQSLLARFAQLADIEALYLLRTRLHQDLQQQTPTR